MKRTPLSNPVAARVAAALIIAAGGGCGSREPGASALGTQALGVTLGDVLNLVGVPSGRCMNVVGGSTADQAALELRDCSGAASQQFRLEAGAEAGYYVLRVVGSDRCLAVSGASTSAGASIVQATCDGSASQQWSGADLGGGAFRIASRASGMVLDAYGAGTANGTRIVQWPSNDGTNQQWKVVAAGEAETYSVTIATNGSGTTSPAPGTYTVAAGTTGAVTATPASGSTFTGWSGAATGTANPVTITVNADTTLTASFAPGGTACSRPVGSCTAPTAKVTEINVGVPVTSYGTEDDTSPLPLAIAAMPSGGSRVAWLGTDGKVYVGRLDCDDKLVGTPFSFPGVDLQDLWADDAGGVVLLTRNATNGGTDQCGTGKLCGGTSSPCRTMWMVRFDDAGTVLWETQVTNLSSSLAGYQDGARFVWWYQHHGRIAYDGTNWAAYFGVAITVNNGSCVDIHEGDRMQVVDPSGKLLSGHNSFEVGCSHAWQSRIVWDPRKSRFTMVCATDNNCRIAQPAYTTVASANCDGRFFGGDLVMSSTDGYWVAWSQDETVRFDHFTTGASDKSITNAGGSAHPHLVPYGANNMLLSWGSGSGMAAQVRDSSTGATVGSQFSIAVSDHNYQAFKAYPDGSAAYPASGSTSTSIKIARVMPCK
jgi:uncharacterized repeat protein (TIGR02543 family)